MAYNPFDVFRRNQKKLFGVLTVFVMFMFVLSFGQGDFFQWLPRLLGGAGSGGEKVAEIDGKSIDEQTIGRVQGQRALASEFMNAANVQAAEKFFKYIRDNLASASKENRPLFNRFQQARMSQFGPYVDFQSMDQQEMQALFSGDPAARERSTRNGLNRFQQVFSSIANTATSSSEDKELAKAAMSLARLDYRSFFESSAGYFGHNVGGDNSSQSALDFQLWLKKADKLGIRYTTEDAKRIFDEEFFKQLDPETLGKVEQQFTGKPGYNRELLFSSLAEEFRVRTCQTAVIGGMGALQSFPTPYDAYEYYRKLCNGGSYVVVNIPADNYIAQVPGNPDENTLRELFTKYRNVEPDPAREGLGLKDPRKLKLGWLEVKGDEAFYKKAGAEALVAAELHAKAMAFTLMPLMGADFGLIAMPAVANLKDSTLAVQYKIFQQKSTTALDAEWFPFFSTFGVANANVIDASILKPGNVAAGVAAMMGGSLTGAGPLSAPLLFWEKARQEDRHGRARALAAMLAPMTDAGSNILGVALAGTAFLPPPLPLEVVRAEMLEKVKTEVTSLVAKTDLEHFEKELAKLGKEKDKTAAKAYLDKFVKDRGLKVGESKDFRDQYALGDDEGLKPLVDKQTRGQGGMLASQFGRSFFFAQDPETNRVKATDSFFAPEVYPASDSLSFNGEPKYLAWRTEEIAAEVPKDFDKTRAKVDALWRRQEARKLAAAAAEDYAKQIRETLAKEPAGDQPAVIQRVCSDINTKFSEQFKTIEDKARLRFFYIDNVSMISAPEDAFGRMSMQQPRQFNLLPSRDIPNPTAKMRNELLLHKDDKISTTIVLNEESKDNYYVATLKNRQDRRGGEFYESIYTGLTQLSQAVNNGLQTEFNVAAVAHATALLRAEFKVKDELDKLAKRKNQ